MPSSTRSLCALLLLLVCLPAMAANDCPAIRAFSATDGQTGVPVTISWSYAGNAAPQSQMLTGHDFAEPVIVAPGQISYTDRALTRELAPRSRFQQCADATWRAAGDLYGRGSAPQDAVAAAWSAVGLEVRAQRTRFLPPVAGAELPQMW
jgi:Thermolysin metallopeptidase, alpha-helical domain